MQHPLERNKPRFFYGYTVVIAAFLSMVVMWGASYSFGIFYKPLLTEFGWTRGITAGISVFRAIISSLLTPFAGRLTDKFGPRVVLIVCGCCLGLGYFLMSRINAIWQLYTITGLVLSLGMTGSFAPMLTTTARWFVKRRGLMTGIVLAGAGVGQIVMSPLASVFILNYGWRTSYVIIAVTTLILVVIAAQFIRRDPTKMGLLPYGANEEELKNKEIEQSGFTFREAIHSPIFWMICVIFIGYMFGQTMVMMHSVAYATDLGYSLLMGANVLVIIGITSVIGKLVMGSAGDRIGNKLVLIITFGMVVIALILLVIANNIWQLYLFAAIYGFAYGGLVTQFSPLVAKIFGLAAHGVIFGAVTASGVIVGSLGPLLAGYIFDVVGSYQIAFIISAVVSSIALLLILLLKPVSQFNDALRQ